MGATPPLWIPAFAGMTKRGAGGIQAYLRPRNTIFVPKPFAYARVDFLSKRFPKRSTDAS